MHDASGKPLQKGDRVTVEFTVEDTSATPDYCNVLLASVVPMLPGSEPLRAWFNGRQAKKVE